MRIVIERCPVSNPKRVKPIGCKILSKSFCCNAMRDMQAVLRIETKWPPRLIFAIDCDDGELRTEVNFCPGCGAEIRFAEKGI